MLERFNLKVGFYCPQNCEHCVVTHYKKYGNLSFNQIKSIVSQIPRNKQIIITGGEPSIRPDFLEILKLCRNHASIGLQTNGFGINEKIVKQFNELNVKSVVITIHSHDKETYLKVSRGPEIGYENAINAIKLLSEYKINWCFQIVVHKLNKDSVLDTFRFARTIDPNVTLKFTYPHAIGEPGANNWDKILCTYSELKSIIDECCKIFGDNLYFEQVPFCFLNNNKDLLLKSVLADPNDDTLEIGFMNKHKFKNCIMSNGRTESKNCNKCAFYNMCPKFYTEYKEKFGDKEFKYFKKLPESFNINENEIKNYMFENFTFWLFMTTKCNSECSYCIQGKKQNGDKLSNFPRELLNIDMTKENLKYIFEECLEIYKKGLVKKFNFNLSGGEPFLVFDKFKDIITEYKEKYPDIFSFNSSSNVTIHTNEMIKWSIENLTGGLISIDSLRMSKPINGASSHKKQIKIFNKFKNSKYSAIILSVLNDQTIEEILEMAEFIIKNNAKWRILIACPAKHSKEYLLKIGKSLIKYLYDNNYYSPDKFNFDGWDLWNQKQMTGCPCGKDFLCIYPNLDVGPTNGENDIILGKFTHNILDLINHPNNEYYREYNYPDICDNCYLKEKCDGMCKANHKVPEMLKEKCDAIRELMEYIKTFKIYEKLSIKIPDC